MCCFDNNTTQLSFCLQYCTEKITNSKQQTNRVHSNTCPSCVVCVLELGPGNGILTLDIYYHISNVISITITVCYYCVVCIHAHIIKLSDPNLSNQMADYILMSILMCHRKIFQYSINKKNKNWNQIIPFDKDNFGITILGYGTIARIVIKKLKYVMKQIAIF